MSEHAMARIRHIVRARKPPSSATGRGGNDGRAGRATCGSDEVAEVYVHRHHIQSGPFRYLAPPRRHRYAVRYRQGPIGQPSGPSPLFGREPPARARVRGRPCPCPCARAHVPLPVCPCPCLLGPFWST